MSEVGGIAAPGRTRVGFIGLGVMGRSMAANILKAGFSLTVHNRSRPAIEALVALGATEGVNPAEVAGQVDVLMMCLPDTPDVERVLFSEGGVAEGAGKGLVVIDASSISPVATRDFAAKLAGKHVELVDMPVSGGPKGAETGTLSCMIGGGDAVVRMVWPVMEAVGTKLVHVGPAGSGQLVKSCNQLVVATALAGVAEAIALCMKSGVDAAAMREVLLGGSARSFVLENHGKRILDGTLAPGFRSRLMLKDMRLAEAAGRDAGVFMPATALAAQLFTALCQSGRGDLDSAALGDFMQELSGLRSSLSDAADEGPRP